jgi:hypothetical protein
MSDDLDLDPEVGMTYVEKLDFREQQHRHEAELRRLETEKAIARAREERRKSRNEAVAIVVGVATFFTLIFGIGLLIYRYNTRPDTGRVDVEQRREQQCITNGGGWVPRKPLANTATGLCVFPSKRQA